MTGDTNWYNAQMSYAKREKMEQFDLNAYQAKVMIYVENILDQIVLLNLPLALVYGDTNPGSIIKRENEYFTFFLLLGNGDQLSFCRCDIIRFRDQWLPLGECRGTLSLFR